MQKQLSSDANIQLRNSLQIETETRNDVLIPVHSSKHKDDFDKHAHTGYSSPFKFKGHKKPSLQESGESDRRKISPSQSLNKILGRSIGVESQGNSKLSSIKSGKGKKMIKGAIGKVSQKPTGTGYKRHDLKYSRKGYDPNKLQHANKDKKSKKLYESLPTVTEQEPTNSENVTVVFGKNKRRDDTLNQTQSSNSTAKHIITTRLSNGSSLN